MTLRGVVLWTHRWLGLLSGIVLILAGVTGAVLVLPLSQPTIDWLIEAHMNLLAGTTGQWVVFAATVASVLLQIGGLYLWWPVKSLRVRTNRGWWRASYDFHNLVGVVALLVMLLLAATAVGRVFFRYVPMPLALEMLPRVNSRLHTAGGFPAPIKALYFVASMAFALQAVTGALVWWRPTTKSRE
jgi:uncharacterized iron-regulated membrane protein